MMIAPVIFALLLGVFIFAILPHAGLVRRTLSVGIFLAPRRLIARSAASRPTSSDFRKSPAWTALAKS